MLAHSQREDIQKCSPSNKATRVYSSITTVLRNEVERKRKQIHLNSQTIITLMWSRTDLCKDRCFLKERSSSYMCDQSKICIMPHVSRSIGALNVMYCTEIGRNSCAASCDWLKPWKEITWYSYMIVLHMHVNTFYVWCYGVSKYNDKNFRWALLFAFKFVIVSHKERMTESHK